jgi:hypothetical protein
MTWDIKIRKVKNGYVCSWLEENNENIMVENEQVFEEKDEYTDEDTNDENISELKCMQEVLYFVKEHFGIYYSKHKNNNLIIDIEKKTEEKETEIEEE